MHLVQLKKLKEVCLFISSGLTRHEAMILPFVLGALGASCRSFKAIVLLFVLHALGANRRNLDQIFRSSGLTRNTVIFLLIVLNALGANQRILTKCLIFWINQEYSYSFAICFNCTLCKSKN
jgi:hypothetical protein